MIEFVNSVNTLCQHSVVKYGLIAVTNKYLQLRDKTGYFSVLK